MVAIIGARCAVRLILLAFVVVFIAMAIQSWLLYKSYIFSHEAIINITYDSIAKAKSEGNNTHERIYELVLHELTANYKENILPVDLLEWIFFNSGGWMESVLILHTSATEYLVFAGSAMRTSGHSGRFWVNTTFTVIEGGLRVWQEGSVDSILYLPGTTAFESFGEVSGLEWSPGTWLVEYGQGFIPSTVWFGLSDTVFRTTDFYSFYKMIRIYVIAMLHDAGFL